MRSLFLHGTRVLLPVDCEKHNCHVCPKPFLSMMDPYIYPTDVVVYMFHLEIILLFGIGFKSIVQALKFMR